MRTDLELKRDVSDALDWDPAIDAAGIRVRVDRGAVTLEGHVPSYAGKLAAVASTERVRGVHHVDDRIEVRLLDSDRSGDEVLAQRAESVLNWNAALSGEQIRVAVEDGHVTLSGSLASAAQVETALRAVSVLAGLRGLCNALELRDGEPGSDTESLIRHALRRCAELEDDADIDVAVIGNTVRLTGHVAGPVAHRAALRAARAAPGVTRVDDHLELHALGAPERRLSLADH